MSSKPTPLRIVLAPAAQRDITSILRWSVEHFGDRAARRYEDLLVQAFRDIAADPSLPGTKQRPELPSDIRSYHLASSRDHVTGDRVKEPRHFVLYRTTPKSLQIVRVLHDSSDLARHLPEKS